MANNPTRCAVVKADGTIENIIVADPSVDTIEGRTLVGITPGSSVDFGYVWTGAEFIVGPELAAQLAAVEAAQHVAVVQEASETL